MMWTMLGVFFANVLLGVPLFLCLLATAIAGFLFVDPAMIPRMLPQQFFGGINSFALMAIPLFILAGNLMNATRLTDRLIQLAQVLVGHFRGGLGYVNVVSTVFFSGVSGSAAADTSAVGSLLIPAMKKEGYATDYAAGLTAGNSLIGPLIPPSIFMILYASLTNTSVGALFLGGVLPGLVLAAGFMVMNYFYARRANIKVREEKPGGAEILRALVIALPGLGAPFIIVAGIVMGIVTPTESAALTAVYAILVGYVTGRPDPRALWQAVVDTAKLTCAIFLIIAAAGVVSWLLSYAKAPMHFTALLAPLVDSPTLVLLCISAITFVTGLFMEEVSALMLLTPVFMPVASAAGVDPVHLGIIITLNITTALITPPVGACLFIAAAISRLDITVLFRTIWPFILTSMIVLLILILFPSITLFLPRIFM